MINFIFHFPLLPMVFAAPVLNPPDNSDRMPNLVW